MTKSEAVEMMEVGVPLELHTGKRMTDTGAQYSVMTVIARPTEMCAEARLLGIEEYLYDDELPPAPLLPPVLLGGVLALGDAYAQGYTPMHSHAPCVECGRKKPFARFARNNVRPQRVKWICKECDAKRKSAV